MKKINFYDVVVDPNISALRLPDYNGIPMIIETYSIPSSSLVETRATSVIIIALVVTMLLYYRYRL